MTALTKCFLRGETSVFLEILGRIPPRKSLEETVVLSMQSLLYATMQSGEDGKRLAGRPAGSLWNRFTATLPNLVQERTCLQLLKKGPLECLAWQRHHEHDNILSTNQSRAQTVATFTHYSYRGATPWTFVRHTESVRSSRW